MINYLHIQFSDRLPWRATVAYDNRATFSPGTMIAWARCSWKDQYNKKIGRQTADYRFNELLSLYLDDFKYLTANKLFVDMIPANNGFVFLGPYVVLGPPGYEKWNRHIAVVVAKANRTKIQRAIQDMNPEGYWYK